MVTQPMSHFILWGSIVSELSTDHYSGEHWSQGVESFGQFLGDSLQTVRLILSESCPVCTSCLSCLSVCRSVCLSVCNVGVLRPDGWMDQDETRHAGRPQPRLDCVGWGPSSP